jgi:hypothetical protein
MTAHANPWHFDSFDLMALGLVPGLALVALFVIWLSRPATQVALFVTAGIAFVALILGVAIHEITLAPTVIPWAGGVAIVGILSAAFVRTAPVVPKEAFAPLGMTLIAVAGAGAVMLFGRAENVLIIMLGLVFLALIALCVFLTRTVAVIDASRRNQQQIPHASTDLIEARKPIEISRAEKPVALVEDRRRAPRG